jgi:hypothetical protein
MIPFEGMRRDFGGSSALDVVVANHLEYRQKTGSAKKFSDRFPNVEERQRAVTLIVFEGINRNSPVQTGRCA